MELSLLCTPISTQAHALLSPCASSPFNWKSVFIQRFEFKKTQLKCTHLAYLFLAYTVDLITIRVQQRPNIFTYRSIILVFTAWGKKKKRENSLIMIINRRSLFKEAIRPLFICPLQLRIHFDNNGHFAWVEKRFDYLHRDKFKHCYLTIMAKESYN